MEENLCESCKYLNNDSNEKPCNSCIVWVDGCLEYQDYCNE